MSYEKGTSWTGLKKSWPRQQSRSALGSIQLTTGGAGARLEAPLANDDVRHMPTSSSSYNCTCQHRRFPHASHTGVPWLWCSPHANIVVVIHMPTMASTGNEHRRYQKPKCEPHRCSLVMISGDDISRHCFINWTGVLLDYLSISISRLTNQEKPQDTKIWMLVSR